MHSPTVLIADDHTILAEGLARLLRDSFDVVGTVADGKTLLDTAERLKPDVIITDLDMPSITGLAAIPRLRERGVTSKVIILTMHRESGIAARALRAGASAFLLKDSAGEELVDAIRAVMNGRVYLTPAVTQDVLDTWHTDEGTAVKPLTKRQLDVLRLIVDGRRMKEIGALLNLSTRTVETHKYEMMRVLDVQSTAELVRYALKHGLS